MRNKLYPKGYAVYGTEDNMMKYGQLPEHCLTPQFQQKKQMMEDYIQKFNGLNGREVIFKRKIRDGALTLLQEEITIKQVADTINAMWDVNVNEDQIFFSVPCLVRVGWFPFVIRTDSDYLIHPRMVLKVVPEGDEGYVVERLNTRKILGLDKYLSQ